MTAAAELPPYRDPGRTLDERVDDLLGRMTLAEKVAQLCGVWLTLDPDNGAVAPTQMFGLGASIDPDTVLADGIGQLTRPLGSRPVDPAAGARAVNELQRRLREETRLGIPAICHEECLTGLMTQGATAFPAPLNLASTWDPDLVRRVTDTIRRQMRMVGAHQGLAPVADVARDARWGRIEETMGEDPYLAATMVTAFVQGLQGDDLRSGVIATLKHFAGYSASEGGRNFAPAHVGPRELADVYLVPFETAIKVGNAQAVMHAYQDVDGEPPAASRALLTGVLRERWGFEGVVVADYGGVSFLHVLHHVAHDGSEASAMALHAGLDVELPNPVEYPAGVPAAIASGRLDESDVDRSVRRVLTAKLALGLFEDCWVDPDAIDLDTDADRALAREVAARSIVLLANDGTLPLAVDVESVAVIGPNGADPAALFGNYSFENHLVTTHFPDRAAELVRAPTVLDALTDHLGADRIRHAHGCPVTGEDRGGIADAAAVARDSTVAVVVLGDTAGHFRTGTVGEGSDVTDLGLPGVQSELLDAVLATGTPTVVVLLNGRPFALPGLAARAAAIVEAWFPGREGAAAVADVLAGAVNPSGRSPVGFPQTAGAMPVTYAHTSLAPGIARSPEFDPVFAFGHGLSYTTFEYADLEVPEAVPIDGEVPVTVTVRNTGTRDGTEVVQLYVRDLVASVTRPVLELKGFARVTLEPGSGARVSFRLPVDLLSFTGIDLRRIVEPGAVEVMVGASSADLRVRARVDLTGTTRAVGEDRRLLTPVDVAPLP